MENKIKVETIYGHTDDGRAFIPMTYPMAFALGKEAGRTIKMLAESADRELYADGINVRVGDDGDYEYDIVSEHDYDDYDPFGDGPYIAIILGYEFAHGRHERQTGKLVACFPNDWRRQLDASGYIPKRYVLVREEVYQG